MSSSRARQLCVYPLALAASAPCWFAPARAAAQETPVDAQPAAPLAPPPPEVAEAAPPPAAPSLRVGVGVRSGLTLVLDDPNSGKAALSLNDGLVDQVNIRPYLSGQLNEHVGVVANFETGTSRGLGISILDAILQLRVVDELQLWIGQHIPANDRNNMNGPFYASSWNFPITVPSLPFDVGARDRGFTLWGLVGGGAFKYQLSVVDLQPSAAGSVITGPGGADVTLGPASLENARLAGRVTINLLEPENFYYCQGTYYGTMDVLALGLVAQYQKGVDATVELDNDFVAFAADLLFEKNLGTAGTFTLEGGYWNLEETGAYYTVNQGTVDTGSGVAGPFPGSSYMLALGWLTPNEIGIGKLHPNGRIQIGDYDAGKTTTLDLGLAYVIDGFNHRWHFNYRHQDNPSGPGLDLLQIGAQFQL